MGCGISSKQAEALKISQGVCMSSRASEKKNIVISGFNGRENKQISSKLLASIIEARVSEIFEAVDYEIEKSGYKGVLKAGLVITGGTSLLPTIGSLAAMITGLETRLAAPDSATGAIDINQPALSTAVGLAIMGLENMEKHNLKGCTTPVNPQEESDNTAENNGNTEEKKEENKKEAPKEPKKERFSFSKLIKGLSNDSMFNDNDA
jgi:cell division ATPase FtsA